MKSKQLHHFILALLLSFTLLPSVQAMGRPSVTAVVVDDEYDRYKKRADDFFKEGKYFEARRQYQNCLEVPGFEDDVYAKGQIEACTTGLKLRQEGDEAMQQGKGAEGVMLLSQLLTLNPEDVLTKAQLADYYERMGNKLFNLKQYTEARRNYMEASNYATATKKELLLIQVRTIDGFTRPKAPDLTIPKIVVGVVAVGAGISALILRSDYNSKLNALNQIDPTGSGIISKDLYPQYDAAYKAAEDAQKRNGLFNACLGVAAVATITEVYLLLHKPKPRANALNWQPSSQSWGVAISYSF